MKCLLPFFLLLISLQTNGMDLLKTKTNPFVSKQVPCQLLEKGTVSLFQKLLHSKECNTCFTEHSTLTFPTLHCGCSKTCCDCLAQLTEIALRKETIETLKCPSCHETFNEEDILKITGDKESVEKFHLILAKRWLSTQDARSFKRRFRK